MAKKLSLILGGALLFAAGYWSGHQRAAEAAGHRVFELRTYTALPGKLPDLHARFRNHTVKLFEKHGMTNIGYFQPQDAPLRETRLIYLLAHSSREAAKRSFDAFRKDPAWIKARTESEAAGKIVEKVESVFLDPLDFSPLK